MAVAYTPTYHQTVVNFVGGDGYRGTATVHHVEAGSTARPTILLLHGFPSSSTQFRETIPMLADAYHVVAPDIPGFGLTTVSEDFVYTFENLAAVIAAWVKAQDLRDLAIYIFDYGAPVGLRLALSDPQNIKAIISQNGNAYVEGLGDFTWTPVRALWDSGNSAAARQVLLDRVLTPDGIRGKYTRNSPEQDMHLIDPNKYTFDYLQNIAGPEKSARQVDLFYDYRTNVDQYPQYQEYFRTSRVPILAVWGKHDPSFVPAGAEAFKQDAPGARIEFVDAAHFALETKRVEIVGIMREWLRDIDFE